MTTTSKISLILCVRDAEEYVGTAVKSLERQVDDPNQLEVILINDGSSDATGDVLRYFGDRLPHCTVIDNETAGGIALARNHGMSIARGEHIVFMDGDDWLAPGRLQVLSDSLDALEVDMVRTDHVTVTDYRREMRTAPFPRRNVAQNPRDGILPLDESSMVDYPYTWAGMFHRRLYDQGLLEMDPELFTAEDRPWIWRLFLQAGSFAVVDAPYYCYRRAVSTSLTQVRDARQLHFIPAFERTRELVEADPDADVFLPKLARTSLAIAELHLSKASKMSKEDREALREGVQRLVDGFPRQLIADALDDSPGLRRYRMARYARRAVGS